MGVHSSLISIYQHLPGPARSLAVNLQGWRFSHSRYGPETDALVEKTLERDRWTPLQWAQYRENRLAFILHHAATNVPYYRAMWERRRLAGDYASWHTLENWPILERAEVQESPRAFLADDANTLTMFPEIAIGPGGRPMQLWRSKETLRVWYALFEARARMWHGVNRLNRWAILGGQPVVPASRRDPPFWVWNQPMRQLYMSAYHLSRETAPLYLEALDRYQVDYLLGYTSALETLAASLIGGGWSGTRPSVVVTDGEPLYPAQRHMIHRAFQCPVRETYGMPEIVAGASECESGSLHLWPEVGWWEVLDQGTPVSRGSGELICTSLLSGEMPLVRYRVGDRVTLPVNDAICPCGRLLPMLAGVAGRHDGLGRVAAVLKGRFALSEVQFVLTGEDAVCLRYVPRASFDSEEALRSFVQSELGAVHVTFERLERIPRAANGRLETVQEMPR